MKKLFAIFGDPVSHSRSPIMHNTVFKNLGFDACYTRVALKDGSKLRDTFFKLKLDGANITVPHKEEAFRACDEVRGFALNVGVVNTIVKEGNRLIGYNTDADGFLYAINEFENIDKILILGAGGTARALAFKFLQEKIDVEILNRSKTRLQSFTDKGIKTSTWDKFKVSKYDLVINTTSAGLKDENLPAPKEIIEEILNSTRYSADAIYGKLTPFLQLSQQMGITFKDGADMLLGQGVLANELFVDFKLTKEDIKTNMQKSFLF